MNTKIFFPHTCERKSLIERSFRYSRQKDAVEFAAFTLPALLLLSVFWLIPIVAPVGISFTDWGYMTSGFQITGLANYLSLFRDSAFLSAMGHTVLSALETVIPELVLGLMLALLV